MTASDDVSEDRGLKELFTAYPYATVEVFVPELIAERGRPTAIEALQQELPLPDLGDPSRFLDMALHCTWANGSEAIIVLVEHWSEARKVDLDRVLWYYAALRLKHPAAEVVPVILVTDRAARDIPDRLDSRVAGIQVLDFRVRVVQITSADLPRLRALQNRVAAMLMALAIRNAVDAGVAVMVAMQAAPGPLDDLRRFLPLALKLAKMTDDDEPEFRRRMREEPTMGNMLDELVNEAKAEGKAEGEARGKIAEIRRLVSKGRLNVDSARAEIEELIATQAIPEAIGREALNLLG
jgi:hypothetical protein